MKEYNYGIAIHGGAGTILRSLMTAEKEQAYTAALKEAIEAGYQVLDKGGSALQSVERAIISLENCHLFNAGKGSVFNAQGKHEMDASIMEGDTLLAGAIAAVPGVKNPIVLAHKVLTDSDHVLLVGEGALQFGRLHDISEEKEEYFFSQHRYDQWQKIKNTDSFQLDHTEKKSKNLGTVGAVALDKNGNLAAGTSTGGMTNKKYGRIGDSALIGAGTYANNKTCAISCTGSGEYFMRGVTAYDISALMEYKGMTLEEAGNEAILHTLTILGGDGGVISIDRAGNISMPFNSEGMYRAFQNKSQQEIKIYKK